MKPTTRKDKTGLIDDTTANDVISQALNIPKQPGRPKDDVKSKRVRFNTMIDKDTRRAVKMYAAKNNISIADVIDQALNAFMKHNG
jgi:predicted HicB family RNase H-like nuclease